MAYVKQSEKYPVHAKRLCLHLKNCSARDLLSSQKKAFFVLGLNPEPELGESLGHLAKAIQQLINGEIEINHTGVFSTPQHALAVSFMHHMTVFFALAVSFLHHSILRIRGVVFTPHIGKPSLPLFQKPKITAQLLETLR